MSARWRRPAPASSPGTGSFRWEDWREQRPKILDAVILPLLNEWAGAPTGPSPGARSPATSGCGCASAPAARLGTRKKTLDRYELLYEAGLTEEARRDGREAALARQKFPALGEPMRFDHRRILATAITRLRAKLQIPAGRVRADAARFHADRVAAHRGSDLRAPSAQAEFPPLVESAALVEPTGDMSTATGGAPPPSSASAATSRKSAPPAASASADDS